eukprot:m.35822 g.35822  ORF g.35822 m.35822 type:complete len:136 (-) comp11193_c0_seq1:322-729(-)
MSTRYSPPQPSRKHKSFSAVVQDAMPKRRRPLSAVQLIGLLLLLVGLTAIFLSYEDTCPDEALDLDIPCDRTYARRLFIFGLVLVLMFCCCPFFALGDARPFYEQFPWLKGRMNRRSPNSTYNAHAASVKAEQTV